MFPNRSGDWRLSGIGRTFGTAAAIVLALLSGGHTAAAADQSEFAVTYQINTQHTGAIAFASPFAPPLKKVWSRVLDTPLSNPLVADGLVFVRSGYYDISALSLTSGKKKWEHLLGGYTAGGAYDDGHVYYVDVGGLMSSLSALSGKLDWAVQLPKQNSFSTIPVAIKGRVYTEGEGTGGTLYSVAERDGTVLWMQPIWGDGGSPAYNAGSLYAANECQYYRFAANDGTPIWYVSEDHCGGSGITPSYSRGRVFLQDSVAGNVVLNAKDGSVVGTFAGNGTPALFTADDGKTYALTVANGTLYCWNALSQLVRWSFAGDGQLKALPVIVNGVVFVGSTSGMLYAVDSKNGRSHWSTNVGESIGSLSAGQGALIVTGTDTVSAYTPR